MVAAVGCGGGRGGRGDGWQHEVHDLSHFRFTGNMDVDKAASRLKGVSNIYHECVDTETGEVYWFRPDVDDNGSPEGSGMWKKIK
jgi:hypothetical protein